MGKKRINNPIIYCFGKKRQRALLRGRVLSKGFGYWRGVFSYSERTTLILAKKERFTGLLVKILYRMWGNVALPNPFSSS